MKPLLTPRTPAIALAPLLALLLLAAAGARAADDAAPNAAAPAAPATTTAAADAQPTARVVVWDGEKADVGTGWAHDNATLQPQTAIAHSGTTALEFHVHSNAGIWVGAGWNWCAFKTGPFGTDITALNAFTFWVKKTGTLADIQLNLLCNGEKFDMPDHHTDKVSLKTYCPQLEDGQWHRVVIPLADLKQPATGFDPKHVGELQMFCTGNGDGSLYLDDLAFENLPKLK